MFLVNYLNRNLTSDVFPLYEGIYLIELLIQLWFLLFSVPVILAIWNTKYFHRNIRLRLITMTFNALLAALARIVILGHQVFGPTQHVDSWYLIATSLCREYFKVYITGLASMLAFDRWIATFAWSWYESRAPTTVFVFLFQEAAELCIGFASAYMLINEIITDQVMMLIYIAQLVVGVVSFAIIFRYNFNEIETLKKGARIESYSISRSFQLRENLVIMKMFRKIAVPVVALTTPCFILYGFYSKCPANIGLDGLRYLAIALYDVWISIGFLSMVINLVRFEPKIQSSFNGLPLIAGIRNKLGFVAVMQREQKVASNEATTYFSMLANDLQFNSATIRIT